MVIFNRLWSLIFSSKSVSTVFNIIAQCFRVVFRSRVEAFATTALGLCKIGILIYTRIQELKHERKTEIADENSWNCLQIYRLNQGLGPTVNTGKTYYQETVQSVSSPSTVSSIIEINSWIKIFRLLYLTHSMAFVVAIQIPLFLSHFAFQSSSLSARVSSNMNK